MDVIWRLFNTDNVWNRIGVRTAVDLNIIQLAAVVGEQDNLQRAIGICELKIRLEEHNVAAVAVRLGKRWKLYIRRDNHLKVVTAAVAKIGEGRILEVAPQKLGIRKLAMRKNEVRPERRLVWTIAHASNEKEISHGASLKTIRRECVSAKTRIALGKPGTWMKSRVLRETR